MAKRKQPTRSKRKGARRAPRGRIATPSTPRANGADGGEAARPADASELIVVGVGASAGGLEAFSRLLQALPPDPGFAIVLVQHLAPHHDSALPTLLSGRTNLPVVHAAEGMPIERNHLYVIPPNTQMGVRDGVLHLLPRPVDRTQYMPIDYFLRSLASSVHERAISVILSGTASDGTVGTREVKAVGGITIAQDPETAKYDGMPRTAIATGLVDLVLSPEDIAKELVRISSHPLQRRSSAQPTEGEADVALPSEQHMEQVFALLRTASGVDFRRYKRPTIARRLQRRMVLHRMTRIDQYLKLLKAHPEEIRILYRDILIHVTRFFREPESFAGIVECVWPAALEAHRDDHPIRIWVPGCSTGEEAYSIAISMLEFLGDRAGEVPVQVFATDVGEAAVEHARAGLYPASIAADVSPERLRRFFAKVDHGYRISKAVRDLCVFARQDLTRDPPFSKLDLILCRNVLIYMGTELQKRLMTVFHYALKPTGFLVLGTAETVGQTGLFTNADKKHRIYRKEQPSSEPPVSFDYTVRPAPVQREVAVVRDEAKSVQGEANRIVQDRYVPPGVIVDSKLHVVQFRGQTGAYLEPAPGDPTLDVLKLAREGLVHSLRTGLQEARTKAARVAKKGARVRANGGWRTVDIEVFPLNAAGRPNFLILFDDVTDRAKRDGGRDRAREPEPSLPPVRTSGQVKRLQQELASSREYLQSIIQELEAANEELQSANEEVLSANEELQSTNEELDTAKEELQSTNEELNTVNDELRGRNQQLSVANSDLLNLFSSVEIAVVIVGSDLSIRRFTPAAEQVLNVRAGDIGRPISHIKPNIDCPDLEELIVKAVESVSPIQRQVKDNRGNWHALRIRPYKNVDNRIDGAVLSLVDVGEQREQALRFERDYAEVIVQTMREPLLVLDRLLRVKSTNKAFCEAFAVSQAETLGRRIYDLGDGQWDIPQLRTLLDEVLDRKTEFRDFEVKHSFPGIGNKKLMLNARRIAPTGDREALILLALEEVADGKGRGSESSG